MCTFLRTFEKLETLNSITVVVGFHHDIGGSAVLVSLEIDLFELFYSSNNSITKLQCNEFLFKIIQENLKKQIRFYEIQILFSCYN